MTMLYVNGDKHTMGAEAVTKFATAADDQRYEHLRGLPHPENIAVSWGKLLSQLLKSSYHGKAELTNTNAKVAQATKEWASTHAGHQKLVIVQWGETSTPVEDHETIWQLHHFLSEQNVNHIFFNTTDIFSGIENQYDWGASYLSPYDPSGSYVAKIKSANIDTVMPESEYFGKNGHVFWSKTLLNHIIQNKMI